MIYYKLQRAYHEMGNNIANQHGSYIDNFKDVTNPLTFANLAFNLLEDEFQDYTPAEWDKLEDKLWAYHLLKIGRHETE